MNMTLQERYRKEIVPQLQHDLELRNAMSVPRVKKVVINVGVGKHHAEPKFIETVERSLVSATGQKPILTVARKSIASFKIREGMTVGVVVTLRGRRMWDFIEKLIHAALPRIRDFRGISLTAVDGRGNLSLGFREHIVFPEIRADEIEVVHGLQVTIVSDAQSYEKGLALFRALGLPFKKK
ncbi:MAG: 50S ribosomal protein L5 [Candidatus Uhrbacteria bacterium]